MDFKAGIYPDMPEDAYHAHPALSASGIKVLAQPGGPAKWWWQHTHPQPSKKAFDVGSAAHSLVLGVGAPLARIPDELLASAQRCSPARSRRVRRRRRGPWRGGGCLPVRETACSRLAFD